MKENIKKERLERLRREIESINDEPKSPLLDLVTSKYFYYLLIIPFFLTILLTLVTLKYAIVIVSILLGLSLHPLLKKIAETFNLIKE
jgi:hypothetical protein